MIAVDDIGAFAVLAFEHPDEWKNRTFSLAGDELSMQQIADAFSRVNAQDVKYLQVSWDQFEKTMGRELTVMYHWFEEKGFHFNIEEVRRDIRRPTLSINGWRGTGTKLPRSSLVHLHFSHGLAGVTEPCEQRTFRGEIDECT
jgi:hypothetical protein